MMAPGTVQSKDVWWNSPMFKQMLRCHRRSNDGIVSGGKYAITQRLCLGN